MIETRRLINVVIFIQMIETFELFNTKIKLPDHRCI